MPVGFAVVVVVKGEDDKELPTPLKIPPLSTPKEGEEKYEGTEVNVMIKLYS
jgi:hypothetical protein